MRSGLRTSPPPPSMAVPSDVDPSTPEAVADSNLPQPPPLFTILISYDPECSALVEQVSAHLQREIDTSRHETIPAIHIDTVARLDPRTTHQALLEELDQSQNAPAAASGGQTFVLTLLKDSATEQYAQVKSWCTQRGLPNHVLTQISNLKDPSLLLRNVVKQILATFATTTVTAAAATSSTAATSKATF